MPRGRSWLAPARIRSTVCSGRQGLGTMQFPKIETGLMDGALTFRQHAGGHTDGPNWPVFIEFADREFRSMK